MIRSGRTGWQKHMRNWRDATVLAVITVVAFAATLPVLFIRRPLVLPSKAQRLAFELGYYSYVCLHSPLADQPILLAEIGRLGGTLDISPVPISRCPAATWLDEIERQSSRNVYGSVVVGAKVGQLEVSRLVAKSGDNQGDLYALAEGQYPRGGRAITPFLAGYIDATELHKQLFGSSQRLRYQVNLEAGRQLFALGFYITACNSATAQASSAVTAQIAHLADALRLPSEVLSRDPARIKEQTCPKPAESGDVIFDHLGPGIGGLFLLGRFAAVKEDLRRSNLSMPLLEDQWTKSMMEIAPFLFGDKERERDLAQFAAGSLTASDLYRRLFNPSEPLISSFTPVPPKDGAR